MVQCMLINSAHFSNSLKNYFTKCIIPELSVQQKFVMFGHIYKALFPNGPKVLFTKSKLKSLKNCWVIKHQNHVMNLIKHIKKIRV